ncbi:MAG: cbb3-type cytochrome c oxidase subunit II [Acetobacteraceae bacterium]
MFIRHETLERNAFLFLLFTVIVIAIGGLVEVIPLFTIETTVEHVKGVRPYSPLEARGRDIYVREGCYVCHSQMIRALRDEVERYGHYSIAAESMYDHPFQWGSKRIDLVPRLNAQRTVGVPYTDEMIANAKADLWAQANPGADTTELLKRYPKAVAVPGNGQYVTEMDALVAYLQVLGTMVDFADPANEQLHQ